MDVRAYDEMYPVYHERDIHQLTDHMDGLLKEAHPYTRLKVRRQNCGLSQSQLASASGVAIRQFSFSNSASETLIMQWLSRFFS